MDFSLTEEQRIIQHTARALLARECPLALISAAWNNPDVAQPLWQDHLRDWLALSEQSLADTTLFMQEYGRALAPGVFFSSLLAAYCCQHGGCNTARCSNGGGGRIQWLLDAQ